MAGDNSAIPPGPPGDELDLEPRQQRIIEALLAEGAVEQADLYLGALRILGQPGFPGTLRFVAHAVREIWNGLREHLGAPVFRNDEQDAGTKRARAMFAKRDGAPLEAGHDPLVLAAEQCAKTVRWFVEEAHAPRKAVVPPSNAQIVDYFRLFEAALHSLLGAFYEGLDDVEQVLANANKEPFASPMADRVKYAIACITKFEQYRHFFKNLANPAWVAPLFQAGFFRKPPPPQSHEENKVSFPMWPESRYLARMAPHVPGDVIEIIASSSMRQTENWHVHADCVDAALTMQASIAARLVPLAKIWLRKPYPVLLPEMLGRLMAKLASEGEPDAALQLADELLEPVSVPRPSIRGMRPEAWPRFDPWQYQQVVRNAVPTLVKADPRKAVSLLCDKPERALKIEGPPGDEPPPADLSHIWRRAIEDHVQNKGEDVKDSLIEATRDAVLDTARQNQELGQRLLDDLESRPYRIFHRIALHVLSELPDLDPERAHTRLHDRTLVADWDVWHEFRRLMQVHFSSLPANVKEDVLRWIEQEAEPEEDQADEETRQYLRHSLFLRLEPIRDQLAERHRERFDALLAEFREPSHPGFLSWTEAGFFGEVSPIDADALANMPDEELLNFLRSWRPPGGWRMPTPRGLGEQLKRAVSQNPARFAQLAAEFEHDIDPTYVADLLAGVSQAWTDSKAFDWQPIVNLCEYVASHPIEHTPLSDGFDADQDWGNAKFAVVSLISTCLRQPKASELLFDLRKDVWHSLQPLTEHFDVPEEPGSDNRKVAPLAVPADSIRAAAVEAVILYALWCMRHLRPDGTANGQEAVLAEMPEVRQALDRHLDPVYDPSDRVRRIYGEYLPWLMLLDRSWVEHLLPRMLPDDPTLTYLRDAAWETYLIRCEPYDAAFELLEGYYRAAVARLEPDQPETREARAAQEALGLHLISFYIRGKLPLDGQDSTLWHFFGRAPATPRADVIGTIGHDLRSASAQFDADTISRLRALWESRLNAASAAHDAVALEEELAQFGSWFASGLFDAEWSLQAFERTLDLASGRVIYWKGVCQRLDPLASGYPRTVVACLTRMADRDSEGWQVDGHAEEIRTVLRAVLSSNDGEARKMARDLINSLGARGFHHFQDLLQQNES